MKPRAFDYYAPASLDEALALLGSRRAPVRTEHQARRTLGVKVRQQVLVDQLPDPGRVATVRIAILVELPEHALGGVLHDFRRSLAGRCVRRGRALALRRRRGLRLRCVCEGAHQPQAGQYHCRVSHFFDSALPWLSAALP